MKNSHKLIIVISLVVLALGLATATIFTKEEEKGNTATIKVRYAAPLTIAAAPVYVADAMGFWNEEGIDVDVTYFDSGRKALDALLSDSAEVMSVSETPPLRSYLSGSEINIIATVTKHKEAKMTVRSDKITKPEDVKGKKLGTVAGTNSDYYMYRWLEANGIKKDEVEIIPLDATALSQAFVQGNVDVMFAWEPHNYNASSKIATMSKSWPTELYSGRHTIVMSSDYLKNNPAAAERVIKGFIKAESYIKNSPDDAKKIVIDRTGMSKDALDKLWGEYDYTVGLDDELAKIIKDQSSWISASQNDDPSVDLNGFVNSAHLLQIESARVGKTYKP
ncbi:MAG: NrtA/SsuA/CpmA family ABC transporter substrate-binding protein [Patescibacteria group bacterium]